MMKHSIDNVVTLGSARPASYKKPVSSGHYSIVNGVEQTLQAPQVVISEKKISSGKIPLVLDPDLDRRGRTMANLASLVVEDSQESSPSPQPAQPYMRFSKAPLVRRPTVVGLDISAELEQLQEQRAEVDRRRKAMDDFLLDMENDPFVLQPRNGEVGWFVRAAFGSVGFDSGGVIVLSVGKAILGLNESLPYGFRHAALSAVRSRVDDVISHVPEILGSNGDVLSEFAEEDRDRILRSCDRMVASLSNEVSALVDTATVAAAFVAAAARRATDLVEDKEGVGFGGFYSLFKQGWIPVGVMNDGEFLVITK